ncbi:MAG: hypothetical protein NUV90_00980 [Candidatus Parcubacteria bacterium]|nr:hypothetical protein [Candidatus Parcubacteria bacterium]
MEIRNIAIIAHLGTTTCPVALGRGDGHVGYGAGVNHFAYGNS